MMTKCWVTDVILHPELLHHSYLIIPLKSKEFGVPMIRCLLTLLGLLALGSLYVVHNLRFSNNMDLMLSSAFMRPKVSIPMVSVFTHCCFNLTTYATWAQATASIHAYWTSLHFQLLCFAFFNSFALLFFQQLALLFQHLYRAAISSMTRTSSEPAPWFALLNHMRRRSALAKGQAALRNPIILAVPLSARDIYSTRAVALVGFVAGFSFCIFLLEWLF